MLTVEGTGKRGTTLLLGWAGGSRKNLAKHQTMHHKIGMRTIALPMTLDDTFGSTHPRTSLLVKSRAAEYADKLDATLKLHLEQHALLLPHSFSNAGLLLLLTLLDRHPQWMPRISGLVVDSAPSTRKYVKPWAAPFVIASSGLPALPMLGALCRHLPTVAAGVASPIVGSFPPLGYFPRLWDTCYNLPRPELYIYSDADQLVSAGGVEDFIAHRRAAGARVMMNPMQGSGHCSHFRADPVKYSAVVSSFVDTLDVGIREETVGRHSRL